MGFIRGLDAPPTKQAEYFARRDERGLMARVKLSVAGDGFPGRNRHGHGRDCAGLGVRHQEQACGLVEQEVGGGIQVAIARGDLL